MSTCTAHKYDRKYVINLHDCKSMRTHWIALYVNGNNVTYSDSFGVYSFGIYSKRNLKSNR